MTALAIEAAHELTLAHPDRDISVDASGDAMGAWDKDRVIQALSNLLGNAIQHGTDPIRLVIREREDRLAVLTRVTNRGRPIDAERITQLFEPFSPALEPGRRSGLGLGLYIVQQIAIAHGALCTVRSTEAETAFEIEWPRVPLDKVPNRD
jgi:signal transduction histidine kinase